MALPLPTDPDDPPAEVASLFDDADLPEAEEPCLGAAALPACPAPDDAQLEAWIAAIVDHDERALLALYEATLSRVYGLVLRLVRRTQLAEEVAEEVYFQVWRQAPRFDAERGRALTWLLGMARSRAIDRLRSGRLERANVTSIEEVGGLASADANPEDQSSGKQRAEIVRNALTSLPREQRESLMLAYFGGYSQSEISEQLGIPLGTVKTRIRLGMMRLRDALAPYGEGLNV